MNILITGGASGVGASIVKKMAEESNNNIYFTYAKSAQASADIEAIFPNCKAIYYNSFEDASIDNLLKEIPHLNLDVLINNAYSDINKEYFHKTDFSVFRRSFEVNVLPTLRITQEAIKGFKKRKFGKIINIITSAVLNKPPIGWSGYTADKAYILSMSKSWATENIRYNITSNCISPSFMVTNLTKDTDERIVEQMVHEHPLKRLLTTDEVAETVAYLTSSSQHVNGINFVINDGVDMI